MSVRAAGPSPAITRVVLFRSAAVHLHIVHAPRGKRSRVEGLVAGGGGVAAAGRRRLRSVACEREVALVHVVAEGSHAAREACWLGAQNPRGRIARRILLLVNYTSPQSDSWH